MVARRTRAVRNYRKRYRFRKGMRKGKYKMSKFFVQRRTNFPKNKVINLRYSFGGNMTTVAGASSDIYFRINSIYGCCVDDNNNAMGFDQWAAFYQKWVVIKAIATISFVNTNARSNDYTTLHNGCIVGGQIVDADDEGKTPVEIPTINQLIESGACTYRIIQNIPNGNVIQKLRLGYYARAWHSVKDVADASELEGTFSMVGPPPVVPQYPSDLTFLRIFAGPNAALDGNQADVDIQYRVTIDYQVLVKDPRVLPESTNS